MGAAPEKNESAFGLSRAMSLYGPLPQQLKDPVSFTFQLKKLLAARRQYRIAEGQLLDVPEPRSSSVYLLWLRLPGGELALTALNFGREEFEDEIRIPEKWRTGNAKGEHWIEIRSGRSIPLEEAGRLCVHLPPIAGMTFAQRMRDVP